MTPRDYADLVTRMLAAQARFSASGHDDALAHCKTLERMVRTNAAACDNRQFARLAVTLLDAQAAGRRDKTKPAIQRAQMLRSQVRQQAELLTGGPDQLDLFNTSARTPARPNAMIQGR